MGTIYLCVGFVLIFGSLNVKVLSLSDYALHFPTKGTSDYVNIWGMPSLTQFTVCLWVKTNATNDGTPFSYAVPGQQNEIVILGVRNPSIYIAGGSFSVTLPSTNDGKWHHVCLSWENIAGSWKLYKDGTVAEQRKSFATGHVIKPGGSLMLAQEQDSLGGDFDINQCFIGMLTNVNVWDHVLSPAEIEKMSKSCLSGEGNVYKWSDFIHALKGETRVVIPSPCKPMAS